jgi:eukaryotic-like serine/threonine-protein kinase
MLSFEHTLTRTGAMIGSVSYMSPEQVRGEKLDPRTDLFSFGLVMYEMATGQRAFRGVTAIEVNEAILQRTPAPAHDWNAELPPKLQEIIDKALRKDRALRYQRAAEICAELKDLKSAMDSGRRAPVSRLLWKLAAAGFFVLLVTSAAMWLKRRQSSFPPEPILRQLTANSSENPIGPSAISPYGKYVAFTDGTHRMRVKIIATDETLTIPEPEALKGSAVRWNIAAWFPDGTRYLANARPPNSDPNNPTAQGTSIWTVSLGGVPRKLRDDAEVLSVSPDGSWIAFGTSASELGDREIWLMDPGGQQARKLYDTDGETALGGAVWAPDGQRLIYFKLDKSSGSFLSRDIKGGPPTTVLSFSNHDLPGDYVWLPDGRLIYSLSEEHEGGDSDNYWELRVDPRTYKPVGKPRRLTNWNGIHVYGTSATADGKRIAFTRDTWQESVDLAAIQANGARITFPTRLTQSEFNNEAVCWTPDAKAVIIESVRNGHRRLFRQALDSDIEEPIFAGAGDVTMGGCSVSPDGSWLFYNLKPKQLMRIPITGGTTQLVLKFRPSTTRQPGWMPRCSVSPAKLCVIAEQSEDGKPIIFTAFDALKGRGEELTRFETELDAVGYNFALSPDGTRIAVLKVKTGDSRIYTLFLNGQTPREITVKGWDTLERLYWAADGKGWFTSGHTPTGWVLLHVDLQGNADSLWKKKTRGNVFILPSPDGRHVAINAYTMSSNVWVIEGF